MKFGKKKNEQEQAALVETIQQNVELAVVEENEVSYGDSIVPVAAKPKKKRKKGRIILIVLVALLVAWIVINNLLIAIRGPAPTAVQVFEVTYGDVQQTLASTGTITAAEKVTIFSPVAAPLADVNAELGSIVTAGTTLFTFDTLDLQRSYDVAAAALSQTTLANQAAQNASNKAAQEKADAQASVDNLQVQQGIARDRVNAATADIASQQAALAEWAPQLQAAIDAGDTTLQGLIEGHMAEANARIEQLTAELAAHQADYEYQTGLLSAMKAAVNTAETGILDDTARAQQNATTVSPSVLRQQALETLQTAEAGVQAPITGVVTALPYEPGAYASQYSTMCVIESIDRVNVIVSLSRYDLENVQVGQEAVITTRGQEYAGRVSKIDSMASSSVSSNGTTTTAVSATIEILKPDNNLTLGLDANVSITVGTATSTLIVPISAINNDVSGTYCYVLENGVAARRDIVMGITGGNSVEISSGLSAGEVVILSSQNIIEGQAVTASNAAATTAANNGPTIYIG